MGSDFCPKHWVARTACGCLIGALVTPSVASMLHGDPQAKLPRVQELPVSLSSTTLATGSVGVTVIIDTTIPNQRYISIRMDHRQNGPLGPTGAGRGDRQNVGRVLTGPMGHPTGPTGGGPPSSRGSSVV
jgi:hypothetical protein